MSTPSEPPPLPPSLPPPLPPPTPSPPEPPKPTTVWQKVVKILGPIGGALLVIGGKLKLVLPFLIKFGGPILKTGGTMILSIGAYTMMWGWKYALGFVLLIFVHEAGHWIVARQAGLKVGAPVFIPFMGAYVALKDAPPNAWIEACVSIGGPLLGSLGAAVCAAIFRMTGDPLYNALAYSGFFLNLFNLAPFGFLDGGRIAPTMGPWVWVAGLVVLLGACSWHPSESTESVADLLRAHIILIIFMAAALVRVWMQFRAKDSDEQRYREMTPAQSATTALLYFGLIVILDAGMRLTHVEPR